MCVFENACITNRITYSALTFKNCNMRYKKNPLSCLSIDCPHQLIADLFLVLFKNRVRFFPSFYRVVGIFITVKTESSASSSSGHRFIVYRFYLIHMLKMSSQTKSQKNKRYFIHFLWYFFRQFDSQSELNVSSINITSFFFCWSFET